MSDITHSDELVTKQDLSDFYQAILPYLGGMPEAIANKFSKSDIYSTSERIVGQWTDGKPIHQKTVFIQNISITANSFTVINISDYFSNVDSVVYYECSSGGHIFPTVMTNSELSPYSTGVIVDKPANHIMFSRGSGDSATISVYFTLRYTKTTDSAVNMGDENDYSTTEKIIGTWVDGKPIYQKTFTSTVPNCTTDGTDAVSYISIGATISTIVKTNGRVTFSSGMSSELSFIANTLTSNNRVARILLNAGSNSATTSSEKNKIKLVNNATAYNGLPLTITVQYTKA